jgi:hypothetical protein
MAGMVIRRIGVMKKWRLPGKVAVLACSVLLLGGYVFVRAGGKLRPTATDDAARREEPMFFSGSKSLQLDPALSVQPPAQDAQRAVIMGGSKSSVILEPIPAPAGEPAVREIIMLGSKSARVFEPEDAAPGAKPAPNQDQAPRSQP